MLELNFRIKFLLIIFLFLHYAPVYGQSNATQLLENAKDYAWQKKYPEALKLAFKAEKILLNKYDSVSIEVTEAWERIADIYLLKKDSESLSLAAPYIRNTIKVRKLLRGENDIKTAIAYTFMGRFFMNQNQPDSTIFYLTKADDILQKKPRKNLHELGQNELAFGNAYYFNRNFTEAVPRLNSAIKIFEDNPKVKSKALARIATVYQLSGELEIAKEYYQQAKQLLSAIANSEAKIFEINVSSATLMIAFGDYFKALEYLKEAEPFMPSLPFDRAKFFINMGVVLTEIGDYSSALEYNKAALRESEINNFSNFLINLQIYNTLGSNHYKMASYDQSIYWYTQGVDYLQDLPRTDASNEVINYYLGFFYFNLGGSYFQQEDLENARKGYDQALSAYGKISEPDSVKIADIVHNQGAMEIGAENFNEGINLMIKAIEMLPDLSYESYLAKGNHLQALGEAYLMEGKKVQAIKTFENVLNHIEYNVNDDNLAKIDNLTVLIEALNALGKIYQESETLEDLEKSLVYLEQMQKVIEYKYKNLSSGTKVNFAASVKEQLLTKIETSILLYQKTGQPKYFETAFSTSERIKSFQLYESLQETYALQIAGIPDSLLLKERNLRIKQTHYEKAYQKDIIEGLPKDHPKIAKTESKLFELKREFTNLKEELEANYPKYYAAKYDLSTISITEIQNDLLLPDQTLLEYIVGDSSIFLFIIQQNHYQVKKIAYDFPLNKWMKQFNQQGIYGYYPLPKNKRRDDIEETAQKNYLEAAQNLYQKLIRPIKDHLTQKVIISTDGVLGYLPFEALLTAQPKNEANFETFPFMVYNHQLSYTYSATLLQQMQKKQHLQPPKEQLLAMAPFFRGDLTQLKARVDTTNYWATRIATDTQKTLIYSGEEVAAINKIMGGQVMYGESASLMAFINTAKNYRILHLSTHGKANDQQGDYAFLAFSALKMKDTYERLYVRDIYNYQFNADLVVLSACETSIGELQKGEGIISLARAFAYAGAKSSFTTLWQVEDEKTKDLMIEFYKQLKQKERKDVALWKAKIAFLKAQKVKPGGEYLHPFFWAGIIGSGDMRAIE